ncbi:hypothetical protein BGZ54_006453 [Gamsiella multidivaricata]|nr:hypothetical protein BGZ54_006453 [Gamsiella multidivaricata]
MNPTRSSYVEYGTGNMLNLDAGTIKRKIDSNEYDDEIIQEIQPNGKRACSFTSHTQQFASFGTSDRMFTPQTPNGLEHPHGMASVWSQSNPSSLLRTAMAPNAQLSMSSHGFGYHTPESSQSSVAASPHESSMDMDMETTSQGSPSQMIQNTNAVQAAANSSMTNGHSSGLLPSALPGQSNGGAEYVPVHGRSMEIPSYARVPLNEVRKYRDQRWSSCIYGADTRIGQGVMI